MPLDVEEQPLVPYRIPVVPYHLGPEDLLAEADDAEGIHIPSRTRHVAPAREIRSAFDCYVAGRCVKIVSIEHEDTLSAAVTRLTFDEDDA